MYGSRYPVDDLVRAIGFSHLHNIDRCQGTSSLECGEVCSNRIVPQASCMCNLLSSGRIRESVERQRPVI